MTLLPVTYWQAQCDACGLNLSDGGEYGAWSDPDGALADVDALLGVTVKLAAKPPGDEDGYLVVCCVCTAAYVDELDDDGDEAGHLEIENVTRGAGEAIARIATWAERRKAAVA